MKRMMLKQLWQAILLDLAERLLVAAIRVAPRQSDDGRRLVVSAMEYFWKVPKDVDRWPPVSPLS